MSDGNGKPTTMIMTAIGVAGLTTIVAGAAGTIAGRNSADAAIERARSVIIVELEDIRVEHRAERADIRQTERDARAALEVGLRRDLEGTRSELREVRGMLPGLAKDSALGALEHRVTRLENAVGALDDAVRGRTGGPR